MMVKVSVSSDIINFTWGKYKPSGKYYHYNYYLLLLVVDIVIFIWDILVLLLPTI